MLHDPGLTGVYLIVDALDECDSHDSGLSQLLDLIINNLSEPSSKVKWLVASRYKSDIEKRLRPDNRSKINLELDSSLISSAINCYINAKVSELQEFDEELHKEVRSYLQENAEGTFLWVALVCKALQVEVWNARSVLEDLKSLQCGLDPLYNRMVKQIQRLQRSDVEICTRILSSVTLTYRPIHLKELVATAGLREELSDKLQALNRLVNMCGSFLTVREETIYFVHQSAKDYLIGEEGSQIFPSGQAEEHREIGYRSLKIMSDRLKRDICDLQMPGALLDELSDVNQEPLAPIRYACSYWVDHLEACDLPPEQIGLYDGGKVHEFLWKHFLHWLEALSLIRNISGAVSIIRKLERLLTVSDFKTHVLFS